MGQAAVKIEEPESNLLSISAIAKQLKLDRATVASRLDDLGYEADESSTAKNKLFHFDEEMEFAIRSAKDTVSATKIRDMRASAKLKEMKLARELGELVPMHEATELVQRLVSTIYAEFTVRQPKRIGPKLAKAKNLTTVKQILKADTEKIFKSLRENFERFIQ